jgi:hypothetical protein
MLSLLLHNIFTSRFEIEMNQVEELKKEFEELKKPIENILSTLIESGDCSIINNKIINHKKSNTNFLNQLSPDEHKKYLKELNKKTIEKVISDFENKAIELDKEMSVFKLLSYSPEMDNDLIELKNELRNLYNKRIQEIEDKHKNTIQKIPLKNQKTFVLTVNQGILELKEGF